VRRTGWVGPRWQGRWRGWGWGFPVAAAVGFGFAAYPYDDGCVVWDGFRWVNV
jgi:hypothetical protein